MSKLALSKPVLVCFYGYPGSGKSYIARNLAESLGLAYIASDRLRIELFEHPRYDDQENAIIEHIMKYMCEEFMAAGVGVAYDTNASTPSQRRILRELARRRGAEFVLVWLQIDEESAFARTQTRDRRTNDDKYAAPQTQLTFDKQVSGMQNPQGEDYLVVSGKHTFETQKSAIVSRFYQLGLLSGESARSQMAKPGLINLVPNPQAGRVDLSRRNISIH